MTEGQTSPDDNKEGQASPDQPKKKPAKAAASEPKPAAEDAPAKPGALAILREPVVMWSVIGGLVVVALALGYVVWNQMSHHHGGTAAENALADRSICEATLDRVQAYGVIPPDTTLSSADPDKTQTDGRVTCHAQSGQTQFAMTVDVHCDDMSKDDCLNLYSVKQNDGTALFQRQM